MDKQKLGDIATVEISGVDKKTKDGEQEIRLCNFVDVYYNWAITTAQHDGAVYTLDGIKVADRLGANTLTRGVYIVDGRKVIIK